MTLASPPPASSPAPADSAPVPHPAATAISATRWLAVGSLLALIVLSLAWELWLAPLRPGGSWLALKALPLLIPLPGLLKNRMYTYRWLSLLIWVYFTEGVVRATSDSGLSAVLAGVQTLLCVMLFVACALHVRIRLKSAGKEAIEADKLRHAAAIGAAADPVAPVQAAAAADAPPPQAATNAPPSSTPSNTPRP